LFTLSVLGFLLVYLASIGLPFSVGMALLVVIVLAALLVDVLTVRLVVAGKRRGVFGYET
jgi:hypothetical protein